MESVVIAAMSGLALWLFVLVLLALLSPKLTGGSIQASSNIQIKGSAAPQGTAATSTLQTLNVTITGQAQETLNFGASTNQMNIIIAQDRTLTTGGSETLDINTGLADIFGATNTALHCKYIGSYIVSGGDTSGVSITTPGSNGFVGYGINTSGTIMYPNGPGYQGGEPTVGITCSATHGNITVTNLSSTIGVTYRIMLGQTTV
jgi:hypothetical protein